MRKLLFSALAFQLLVSCWTGNTKSGMGSEDLSRFVNPFVGTSRMGHTYPGATAPFGMVQLSPQTDFVPMYSEDGSYNRRAYQYCAGYQYRDSTIIGFAHTNFSGTGHSDLGDFLMMPVTGDLVLEPLKTTQGKRGFYST